MHRIAAFTCALLLSSSLTALGSAKVFDTKTDAAAVAKLKRSVAYVMSLSDGDLLAIVPTQSGIYFTDCPNCDKGTQDRGDFTWEPERPAELLCKGCGAKYPHDPKYPDDKVLEVPGPDGPHRYPYYERPDKYRIFFRAHAHYWAREYMAEQCQHLAELWSATRDDMYAHRSALILLRFAEVYPGYAYHMDLPFRPKRFSPYTKNRVKGASRYRTAKWSWWAYMDVSNSLVRAHDALREWPGLAKMADGKALPMIEDNLFGAMVDFVLGFREPYSNMSPVMWRSVIYAGRVLRRPKYVQEAIRRFHRFTKTQFLHDGHWKETAPSYCSQVYGLLKSVSLALDGYTPPDDSSLPTDDVAKTVRDVAYSLNAPRLPNGRLIPVNDTWSTNRRSKRTSMESVVMPGLGVAVLGGGEGENQLHVHLNFTAGRGHKHRDALSLGLFAFSKELFPDIGYTHTKYRAWPLSMMSHNTVVVDGRESGYDLKWTGNRLRAFATDDRGFHFTEAESRTAYPGVVRRYQRTLIAVGNDSRDSYLVDVFLVEGGQQHDYLLHGCADEDSTAKITGADMEPFDGTLMNPGVEFVSPKGESSGVGLEGAYGFVHDLSSGIAKGAVALDIRLAKASEIGTRTLLLTEPDTVVYLGEAPSIRRSRRNDSTLDNYQAPFFCARRKGKDLRSVFVAVHEPLKGPPKISAAAVKRMAAGVIVTIDRANGARDHVLLGFDSGASLTDGNLSFTGRCGLIRLNAQEPVEAHLVGSSHLSLDDFELSAVPAWSGTITRAVRDRTQGSRGYFEVPEAIEPSSSAQPRTLMVHHPDDTQHAYNIVRIEPCDEGSLLYVREDPALEITDNGTTQLVCYPQREIKGSKHTYELLNAVHMRAQVP